MTELERFFRRIVLNLAAIDPGRLRHPVPLAEIPFSIVPYRTNRRVLQVDTSEEYEMVLLRLCAGEGDYLWTEPEEVRLKFEAEAGSSNPDLEIVYRFEDVTVTLRPERVTLALQTSAYEAQTQMFEPGAPSFEPPAISLRAPAPTEEPEAIPEDEIADDDCIPAEEMTGSQCVYCGGSLPDRPLNFCPHCGQSQVALVCPHCHADVEAGWRHCVNCGRALGGR
ncbi:MAG TPA: zinc ribbon domain-containing protein [Gemmatimonadales bacterium]